MYDFHYSFIKKLFGAELLFTDADSLTYEIKSEDVYEEFLRANICNYAKDSNFFNETNKKVIGKMKDKSEGKIIYEFFGLKSKMYSIKDVNGKESTTAKGVNITTQLNEFKDTLFNIKIIKHKMRKIQGKKHKMGTYEINKMSLCVFDDKRFVLDNAIHTLSYFHKNF